MNQPRDSMGRFLNQNRKIRVTIRMTPEEYADLRYCSESRDISMTEFLCKVSVLNAANDRQRKYMQKIKGIIQNHCDDFVS